LKTVNGDLYIVADGASSHDGTKTGGDVVRLVDRRLKQDAANIKHRQDLNKLLHSINAESTKLNEGAYAAIAGIWHRKNKIFGFGSGDVSIIAGKANGKLIQVLPLDLSIQRDEAEKRAKAEIGTIVNEMEITEINYKQRIEQYLKHGLCNAIGFGESFSLNTINFDAKDGTVLLIASDGVTDVFMNTQTDAGRILESDAPKLYNIINSNHNAEDAANALKEMVWDTQVEEKKKIKVDDRTGIFFYMNAP
jgi:serine/threonine protein phosphatase PrpC